MIYFQTEHSTGHIRSTAKKINNAGGQQAVPGIIWEALNNLGLK